MTSTADNTDETTMAEDSDAVDKAQGPPVWLRASLADLVDLDFEEPIAASQSADSNEIGQQFRGAIDSAVPDGIFDEQQGVDADVELFFSELKKNLPRSATAHQRRSTF